MTNTVNKPKTMQDILRCIDSVLSNNRDHSVARTIKVIDYSKLPLMRNGLNLPNTYCFVPSDRIHSYEPDPSDQTLHSFEPGSPKQTLCLPGDKGASLWYSTLDKIFDNPMLIRYAQDIAGTILFNKTRFDYFVIACGKNKYMRSLFWNTISIVLNTYSGVIDLWDFVWDGKPADPTLSHIDSLKLLLAPNIAMGLEKNDEILKSIYSEEAFAKIMKDKDKSKFSFTLGYVLVLYDDYLQKVIEEGADVWDKLIILPFNSKYGLSMRGDASGEAYELACKAGPAVLQWMLNGAKRVFDMKFNMPVPACVEDVTRFYREINDVAACIIKE